MAFSGLIVSYHRIERLLNPGNLVDLQVYGVLLDGETISSGNQSSKASPSAERSVARLYSSVDGYVTIGSPSSPTPVDPTTSSTTARVLLQAGTPIDVIVDRGVYIRYAAA